MIYILFGILAYLALGVILTRSLSVNAPTLPTRFIDVVVGAVFMPVIIFLMLLCILAQDLWARLLIALDFDPPEEMRAGPDTPAGPDSIS